MGRRYPKRTQLKYTKQCYRVRNWRQYEVGLRRRGDLTLWFSEEAIAAWRAPTSEKPGGISGCPMVTVLRKRALDHSSRLQTASCNKARNQRVSDLEFTHEFNN